MNIANKITIIRILLIPLFVLALASSKYISAFIVFFIASYTDHLDGKLARKYNQVTNFGKFADPLADKALVMSAFVYFVEIGEMNSIALILMLTREFVVMSVRLIAVENNKVIAANYWGKAKTVSQIITVFLVIGLLIAKNSNIILNDSMLIVKEIFVWLAVAISCISGIIYINENYTFIKNTK